MKKSALLAMAPLSPKLKALANKLVSQTKEQKAATLSYKAKMKALKI